MLYCRRILILGIIACLATLGILTLKAPVAGLVLGVVLLAVAGAARRKTQQNDTLGSARFASSEEIKAAGMLSGKPGFMIGKIWAPKLTLMTATRRLFDRRVGHSDACEGFVKALKKKSDETAIAKLSNAVHVVCFAPSGAGKGVSNVIPFLLDCPDSVVVVDFKGENALLTAEHRARKFGHEIVVLDPFDVVTEKCRGLNKLHRPAATFNPFDMIDPKSPFVIDECNALANALVMKGDEKDPYWVESAEFFLSSIGLSVALYSEPDDRSLQTVRNILTNPASRAGVINYMSKKPDLEGMVARKGNQLANFKDKELAGVLNTTNRFTSFLDTLAIKANTTASSFDPYRLNKGKMSIFLVLPPEHMRAQSALLRVWVNAFLKAVVKGGLQEQNKVHFVLDEAASLGRMDVLDDAVDKFRGYGVRCQFFYQSMGQLQKCWGEGGDQTLLSNCSQVFFGINDKITSEYASDRLGEYTAVVESGGTNCGGSRQFNSQDSGSSTGMNWGANDNWGLQARKLFKPEELTCLNKQTAISLVPGLPPIISTLVPHFENSGKNRSQIPAWKAGLRVWAAAISFLILTTMAAFLVAQMKVNQ